MVDESNASLKKCEILENEILLLTTAESKAKDVISDQIRTIDKLKSEIQDLKNNNNESSSSQKDLFEAQLMELISSKLKLENEINQLTEKRDSEYEIHTQELTKLNFELNQLKKLLEEKELELSDSSCKLQASMYLIFSNLYLF